MVAKICCDIFSMQCSWKFSKEPRFSSIAAHWLLNSSWFHWPGGKKVFYTGAVILLCLPKDCFFFFTWSLTSERDASVPDIFYCGPSAHTENSFTIFLWSSGPKPPGHGPVPVYGHSVPGRTEKKNNSHYFVLSI